MICYDSNMCSDGFESLSAALTALADDDPDHRPDTALTDGLLQLRRAIDGLEAQWLRWLAAFDRRGTAASTTATSTTAWVRSTCRLSPTTARDRVALARALPGLPDTAAALAAGDISAAHAQLVALALGELAQAGGAQLAADTEPALVEQLLPGAQDADGWGGEGADVGGVGKPRWVVPGGALLAWCRWWWARCRVS